MFICVHLRLKFPMPLQIFLNATLRQYVPGYDPYKGISLEVPPGTPVGRVMTQLGLPAREVTLIMVDGRRQEADFSCRVTSAWDCFRPSAAAEMWHRRPRRCFSGAGVPPAL